MHTMFLSTEVALIREKLRSIMTHQDFERVTWGLAGDLALEESPLVMYTLLSHYRSSGYTITEMADVAGVSAATMHRFVRSYVTGTGSARLYRGYALTRAQIVLRLAREI